MQLKDMPRATRPRGVYKKPHEVAWAYTVYELHLSNGAVISFLMPDELADEQTDEHAWQLLDLKDPPPAPLLLVG